MQGLERLDAYRLALELAVEAYRLTRQRPLSGHPILADQIARAAVSIPANVAEGYGLGSSRQLVRGLRIAFGSVAELRTHLWVASRVGALPVGRRSIDVIAHGERVIAILTGLLKHYGARVGRR